LTGQGTIVRQATAGQLEEGIMPQGVGIVLVLIAAGKLEDPLADEGLEGVRHRTGAPVGDLGGQGSAQPEGRIGFSEPGKTAITGQVAGIEASLDRERSRTGKAEGRRGRLGHEASPVEWWADTHLLPQRCLVLSSSPYVNE
jgi:hypothetical protein